MVGDGDAVRGSDVHGDHDGRGGGDGGDGDGGDGDRRVGADAAGEAEGTARPPRVALLVIHGIGQQQPLQPLDGMMRGFVRWRLRRQARAAAAGEPAPPLAPTPRSRRLAGRITPYLRLAGADLELPAERIDVHEFYWADRMRGRIGVRAAFRFLIRSGLAGLNFRQQLPMLLARGGARRTWPGALATVAREVGIAATLLLVVALLLTLPLIFAVQLVVAGARGGGSDAVVRLLRRVWAILTLPLRQSMLIDTHGAFVVHTLEIVLFGVVALLFLYLLQHVVGGWWTMMRIRARHLRLGMRPPVFAGTSFPPRGARPAGWTDWRWLAGFTLLGVALVGAVLGWRVRTDLAALVDASTLLLRALWRQGALLIPPLLVALLVWGSRRVMVEYVGDIALYATTDPHSPYADTRREIQTACADAVSELLTEAGTEGYDAVFVAGHSLGSVIAYDALNSLAQRRRAGVEGLAPSDLAKLRGLLTFGSPLDKIYYFYRQLAREQEAIRGQLLSYTDSTHKRSSERYYGPYQLARYGTDFEDLLWVNVYALADPVSGYLDHYRLDPADQHALPYVNPIAAHNAYWNDLRFTEIVLAWLRRGVERSG